MVKLVKIQDGKEIVMGYPLAECEISLENTVIVEHKSLFKKWTTKETVYEKKHCYLMYIPDDEEPDLQFFPVEKVLEPVDDFKENWVKKDHYVSDMGEEYDIHIDIDNFYGEKFILEHNNFMALVEEWEWDEYMPILEKEKPELFEK